ncbi:hypothetical protein NPX13_g6649 [Xylaria arbuscula]|uniref:Aminoglycoside phosphotransferase domain-containing protein n=1 Tax=Xylaria arbuscula TaxID=114810 RepID=A0A9W8TJX7_9PEZI|nr:hypothetical protein NPX13_g6649 [Xylaria arbuscula]
MLQPSMLVAASDEPLDDEAWEAAQTAELVALKEKTNHAALLRRATELSGGLECRLDDEDPLGRRQMGGMHVHLRLIFEDGTVWLARILRQRYTSFDDKLSNYILLSRPFDSWAASEEQKLKVLDQWSDVLCTLSKHPRDRIGSLTFDGDGAIQIGPIASDRTGTLPCIGPFKDARAFYSSWAEAYLELISDGQLFSQYPLDAYLIFKFLAEQAKAGAWFEEWQDVNSGPFFLAHTDDKGDHILVDDDFRITGIIDWSFARVVPAYEVFGPSLVSADNSSLFSGEPGLSEEDRTLERGLQRRGAPHYFHSDKMRRFLFGIGMGLGLTRDEAINVFRGLVSTFDGTAPNWQEWRQTHLSQWADDARLVAICKASGEAIPLNSTVQAILTPEVHRFATCSISPCGRPGVDDATWEMGINNEVEALLAQVNIDELTRAASSLRKGISCKFQPGQHLGSGANMGCANYHAWIIFDDRVKWLARIPRTTAFSDIPINLVDYLIESEYATLKFLEKHLSIPAPKAYGFGLFSDPNNMTGVGYIFEDAMPGRPFYAHEATDAQKSHVYDQYADILVDIRRVPVRQACSLLPHGEDTKARAIASNRFLSLGKHGPFADPFEYFTSIADLHLDLIADGQLYPEYPKEAFLFHRLLRDRAAPALAAAATTLEPSIGGSFYLKHVDDKGDHLLVDDDYNITAVIDWQFARFVPTCEAFGSSLFTADMSKLYSSSTGLSADDSRLAESLRRKGREDLAGLAGGSELARRFHFGLASGLTKDEALGMIEAVLVLLDGKVPDNGVREWMEKEWCQLAGDARREKVEKLVAELEKERMTDTG